METKIRDEPEYGTIKKTKTRDSENCTIRTTKTVTEISVYKPDSNQIEETFTFPKVEIYKKKTYHRESHWDKEKEKNFKVKAKRQITLEDDFIVNISKKLSYS